MSTTDIRVETRYDEDRGRTVLYDAHHDVVLFEATEEGAEMVEDMTEFAIALVLRLNGRIIWHIHDEDDEEDTDDNT